MIAANDNEFWRRTRGEDELQSLFPAADLRIGWLLPTGLYAVSGLAGLAFEA